MMGAKTRVGLFLGILALGAWPSPRVALSFSAAYSALANLVLAGHTFGERGRAVLVPLREINRREGDNVTADAVLALSVEGYTGSLPLGISLRRDVYLPLLIVLALIAAFPLQTKQRLRCLALGVPTTLAAGITANWLVAAWTFSVELNGVYPASPTEKRLVEWAYGALLAPPGNRFIAPIALAAALIGWQLTRGPTASPASSGAAQAS